MLRSEKLRVVEVEIGPGLRETSPARMSSIEKRKLV
jgi:hypothetical protein